MVRGGCFGCGKLGIQCHMASMSNPTHGPFRKLNTNKDVGEQSVYSSPDGLQRTSEHAVARALV